MTSLFVWILFGFGFLLSVIQNSTALVGGNDLIADNKHLRVIDEKTLAVVKACPSLSLDSSNELSSAMFEAVDVASDMYGVDPELLMAMIIIESRCQVRATSRKGAMGLMQLMPSTAAWLGVTSPFSVRDNILGGAKYMSYLLDSFEGDLTLALAAYNAGPVAVKKYSKIPPYRETRKYVTKVQDIYGELRSL